MAKKKSPIQLLSPENYIRQKARNLPIFECKINSDWENMGTAQIVVSRLHTNGNLTFALYMVDLLCLGTKETYYRFNSDKDEYDDLLENMSEDIQMMNVDYPLIHNVIFAANEFAAELGFKPAKDFTSITQYLLEEDTDDIELIEIECGRNGKPVFVETDSFSEAQSNQIINQLDKAVGRGNFDVIFGEDGDEMDFDDEYAALDADERRKLFEQLTRNGVDELTYEEHKKIMNLTNSIYLYDVCDDDTVEELILKLESEVDLDIAEDNYTAESLGIKTDIAISGHDMEEFDEVDGNMEDNPLAAELQINELRNKWGNIPYICYLELKLLENTNRKDEYKVKLDEYAALYPEFSLLKIEKIKAKLSELKAINPEEVTFNRIFERRSEITDFEMFAYQFARLFAFPPKEFNSLEALYSFCEDLDIAADYSNNLLAVLSIIRINLLKNYFDSTM
jgi:hypothetical protein